MIDHVGGNPSATERALIEQIVLLTARCCQNEAKILVGKDTEFDSKSYLAWSNALRRALRDLGMQANAVRQPSLAEVLKAERAA
jgi:hypothetical protein